MVACRQSPTYDKFFRVFIILYRLGAMSMVLWFCRSPKSKDYTCSRSFCPEDHGVVLNSCPWIANTFRGFCQDIDQACRMTLNDYTRLFTSYSTLYNS
ncbi:hypothetical protein K474DRAFT_518672 [Panus rudis PR-1116 ss-1]|nr:hypothetical protein K474DRAFT_518672 [Panus rudis PR-1116 ss-1]